MTVIERFRQSHFYHGLKTHYSLDDEMLEMLRAIDEGIKNLEEYLKTISSKID